tara:strand:+ start:5036 stop:5992 length:957 start_codon:yes stop_codon:yes gene_type:complete
MEKVIFDTNAYRYLAGNKTNKQLSKKIQKLKDRENKNGIESLLSPIVAKELLAHVSNKKDPSYSKCLRAIKAQYYHSGNDKTFTMIPTPELLISKSFFYEEISSKTETNNAIGQMIFHFAKSPTDYVYRKFQKNLNENTKHVKESEDLFAFELQSFLKKLDPNCVGWKAFNNDPKGRKKALTYLRSNECSKEIAMAYLYIVHALLIEEGKRKQQNDKVLYDELYEMSSKFIKVFPEPIALYKLVIENLINSDFNLFENSRSNFVWDIHLMFNVGQNTIGKSKTIFVTSDKAIIETALKTNTKNLVFTFEEYMEYLGLK